MARASKKKAVVLLSGGLDSATALAIARSEGFETYALSFRYGQRHVIELECARRVASALGARDHVVVEFDLRQFGGSALTSDIPVPKDRSASEMSQGIPVTYVPARNTIFLAFALAWAETLAASDIFIGVNALDYSGYPDCRPEYVAAFEKMANLATKAGVEGTQRVEIHTPLIRLTKARDHCRRPRARRRLCADLQLLRSGVRRRSMRQVRRLPVAGEGIRRDREARSAARQIRIGVGSNLARGFDGCPRTLKSRRAAAY